MRLYFILRSPGVHVVQLDLRTTEIEKGGICVRGVREDFLR